ncbi:MAG: hypothetical protein Q9163_003382 [Psora crenata]
MPDKPLTVFTYAASASLAAIALVYFFHPNYLFDGDSSTATGSTRKKGIVGLSNPANDCFINCILQSLAGLGDLRVYLIRELHRRKLEGQEVYGLVPEKDANGKEINVQKLLSLQKGDVTRGLKDIIDRLNERPIYKKTVSAVGFIRVLERAFGTKISKAQQDAQELLQIVAERLSEEYHAGKNVRKTLRTFARRTKINAEDGGAGKEPSENIQLLKDDIHRESKVKVPGLMEEYSNTDIAEDQESMEEEDGFPLEGQTEARTECQYCHFTPKAKPTTFVMLNLMVPQKPSSSLNDCFDAHFKTEYIDDYKCDKCRLEHAIRVFTETLAKAKTEEEKLSIETGIQKLKKAIIEDPETVPEGVGLPDIKLAPERKIARHIEIVRFPKVLVIHLSRSIYDLHSSSMKNMAKVTFPEKFPVGGILNRRTYKLLCMVTHKGTHNSGHYETFRRQYSYAPYSNPYSDKTTGPYSTRATPNRSMKPSPNVQPALMSPETELCAPDLSPAAAGNISEFPDFSPLSDSRSTTLIQPSPRPVGVHVGSQGTLRTKSEGRESPINLTTKTVPMTRHAAPGFNAQLKSKSVAGPDINRAKPKKKAADRWWRISDDKIKECKTIEVLDMKKEVYLLFYEMEGINEGG